jgi:hypothetical protein
MTNPADQSAGTPIPEGTRTCPYCGGGPDCEFGPNGPYDPRPSEPTPEGTPRAKTMREAAVLCGAKASAYIETLLEFIATQRPRAEHLYEGLLEARTMIACATQHCHEAVSTEPQPCCDHSRGRMGRKVGRPPKCACGCHSLPPYPAESTGQA